MTFFRTRLLDYAPDWRTVLSAVLIVLSFPPFDITPLIWLALIPWFSALMHSKNWQKALIQGIWLSSLMTLGGFYWIAYALHEFGSLPWPIGMIGLLLFSVFGQPQFPLFALCWKKLKYPLVGHWKGVSTALTLSLLYVGLDWILPKLFKDSLGHSLYTSTLLRQAADLGGASLLTFLIYLVNHSLWSFWRFYKIKKGPSTWPAIDATLPQLLLSSALIFVLALYGHHRNKQVQNLIDHPKDTLQAAVIQANIGDFDKIAAENGVRGAAEKVMDTFFTLSDRALSLQPKPDVMIWPETSYPSTFRTPQTASEFSRDQLLESFVRSRGVPLLFGGYDHADGKDFNAFFFLSPDTKKESSDESNLQIYRKNILLLFGEFIPGAEWFSFIKNAFPQVGNFGRGPGPSVLQILTDHPKKRAIPVNPIICYEALFPNFILEAVRNGSEIILNITNDSWFGPYGEPYLHQALSAFRSIESRKPQIRSTNTGFSSLILPTGEITERSGIGTQEILNFKVPIISPITTLMLLWGDWFGRVALAIGVVSYFFMIRNRDTC